MPNSPRNAPANSTPLTQAGAAPEVQIAPKATAVSEQSPMQPDADIARRAKLWGEINAAAQAFSASWVVPEGATQPSTPVLHRMRAILHLNPGLTQRQIGDAVGFSQALLSLYLRGLYRGNAEHRNILEGKLVKFASDFISGAILPSRRRSGASGHGHGHGRGRGSGSGSGSGSGRRRGRPPKLVDREHAMMERIRRKQMETLRAVQHRVVAQRGVIRTPQAATAAETVRDGEFRRAQEIEMKLNGYRQMQEHVVQLQEHAQRPVVNGADGAAEENGAERSTKRSRVVDELDEMEAAAEQILLLENKSSFAQHDPELPLKKQYQLQRYLLAQQRYIMVQQEHILQQQELVLARQRIAQQCNAGEQNITNDVSAKPDGARAEVETSPKTTATPPSK